MYIKSHSFLKNNTANANYNLKKRVYKMFKGLNKNNNKKIKKTWIIAKNNKNKANNS